MVKTRRRDLLLVKIFALLGRLTLTSPDRFDLLPVTPMDGQVSASSILEEAFRDDTQPLPKAAFSAAGPLPSFVRVALSLPTEKEADEALQKIASLLRGARFAA